MSHEMTNGVFRAGDSFQCGDLPGLHRKDGDLIDICRHGLHEKEGEDQRKANEGLVGGRGLKSERLAQKVKDDQQPCEWRHA